MVIPVISAPDCANQTYVEGKDLKLECDLARSDKGILEYTVSWEHNNVALKTNEDAKYSIVSNTLRIQNPSTAHIFLNVTLSHFNSTEQSSW